MERAMRSRCLRGILVLGVGLLGATGALAEPEFDHDMTRFPLFGAHDRTRCESCHVGARFVGTPTSCAYCHDGTNKWAETAKNPLHFPTAAECSDCHTSRSWLPARMDHASATEPCATCHNFGFAEGKPPLHPQSTNACEDCHNTLTWAGAGFDHSGVTGDCFTCHNGVEARGKEQGHVASSNECQLCHSTRRWVPAGFDHSGVTAGCVTCHNGMDARGKEQGHVASSDECQLCHSTRQWRPAGFDHSEITGNCSSCHDGNTATGMDPGHFMTQLDCNTCHSTASWGNADYDHVGNYPGDHRGSVDCRDCHTGNSAVVAWPSPGYQPDCAGCHASDYREGPHKKHENPDVRYSVSELRDCTGACHVYTDASLTVIKERRNGPEHRTNAGDF